MERRLAAILLTDMVSYSRLLELDEDGTIARQKAHRQDVFDPQIAAHGGRIVKSTGDGLLVEFPSVVDAVRYAVEIQTKLASCDKEVEADRRVQYRIGINLGDIMIDGDDIMGDGVNADASRFIIVALQWYTMSPEISLRQSDQSVRSVLTGNIKKYST